MMLVTARRPPTKAYTIPKRSYVREWGVRPIEVKVGLPEMRCSTDDNSVALHHDDVVVPADKPCDVAELIRIGRDREAAERGSEQEADMSKTLTLDDLTTVKEKQHATWSSGDYAVIGTTLQLMGEWLCEAVDVSAGWKVLDVAAGNGNAALAAARRGCEVVATDYVEGLLDRARLRADADGLTLATKVADAEDLPFEDGIFDAVLSTVGVMFTPDPRRAARQLVRVVRPGGRIGLANWTPEGFVGQMFRIIGQHVPPPAGVPSPLQWGTEAGVEALLGGECNLEVSRRSFTFRYRSAPDYFETFGAFYGPIVKALAALDETGRASLRDQLVALAELHNRNENDALSIDSEYLEVIATRR
jgi:SAM-dependent methyltransferase